MIWQVFLPANLTYAIIFNFIIIAELHQRAKRTHGQSSIAKEMW